MAVAYGRHEALMPQAVPILADQLVDNRRRRDAKVAKKALLHFGPAAIPLLEPYLTSMDDQQGGLVATILAHLPEYGDDHFNQPGGRCACGTPRRWW